MPVKRYFAAVCRGGSYKTVKPVLYSEGMTVGIKYAPPAHRFNTKGGKNRKKVAVSADYMKFFIRKFRGEVLNIGGAIAEKKNMAAVSPVAEYPSYGPLSSV